MPRVLIISNLDSIWTIEFIRNVLVEIGVDVSALVNDGCKGVYFEEYKKLGVTIIEPKKLSATTMQIPVVRTLVNEHSKSKAMKPFEFDFVINMFVHPYSMAHIVCQKKNGRAVALFCGSDMLRADANRCWMYRLLLRGVDQVVFASTSIADAYHKKIGTAAHPKEMLINWGMSGFSYVDRMDNAASNKRAFGIDEDTLTVCIGYNGNAAQNHIEILNQIKLLPEVLKSKTVLLLPMTYPQAGNEAYIPKVCAEAESTGCKFFCMTEFMSREEMAKMWLATDILIHAQPTDALSASLQEALYAGVKLINGDWLAYKEYENWGVEYTSFRDFSELPAKINELSRLGRNTHNHEVLKQNVSWDACREKWAKIILNSQNEHSV